MSFKKIDIEQSITKKTLLSMGGRITLIIIITAIISYLHIVGILEDNTVEQLDKYIVERSEKESQTFVLSEKNQHILRTAFLERLTHLGNTDPIERFEELYEQHEDGTVRMRAKYFHGIQVEEQGIVSKGISSFIGKGVEINADLRRRAVIAYDLMYQYGRAWSSWDHLFINLYISFPEENGIIMYYEDAPWGLTAPTDLDSSQEEWGKVANSDVNPERETVWTSVYFDSIAQVWMVSCATPIYVNNRHIATIGHDIKLDTFFKRTVNDRLEDTYNMVLSKDGTVIVHPDLKEKIKATHGHLHVSNANKDLVDLYRHLTESTATHSIIDDDSHYRYIAMANITGTDWTFFTIYPKKLLAADAFSAVSFIFLLGVISLIIEVAMLALVLYRQVSTPLNHLLTATRSVTEGAFDVQLHLDVSRKDELGQLARAFNHMSNTLKSSFDQLEANVKERTQQLEEANLEISQLNGQLKEENVRMGAELHVTRQLQQMLLPKESELNAIHDLDISGFMEPASEIGGDYYDVLQQGKHIKIGIGDVTGHGLESGVLMLMVQTAVRTLLINNLNHPEEFLSVLNNTLYKNIQRIDSDKSLSLSLIDYKEGSLSLSGQHEEVLLVSATGEIKRIDTIDLGFPIGLEADISEFVDQHQVDLNLGDGLVLYTDGITESENKTGDYYGIERLCEVISGIWENNSAKTIQEAIISDVYAHISDHRVYDDITLLVIKKKV